MQSLRKEAPDNNPVADIYEELRDRRLLRKVRDIREEHDAHIASLHKIPAQIGQAICTLVPIPLALWAGLSVVTKTTPVDDIHFAGALGVAFIAATTFFKFRHDFARAVKTQDYNGLLDDLVDFRSKRAIADKAPKKNL